MSTNETRMLLNNFFCSANHTNLGTFPAMGPNPVPLTLPILLSSTVSGLASEETGTSFSVDEATKSPAAG